MANHEIIVIGASMGGVEALTKLAAQLPADLAAAVFVVLHVSAEAPGFLADILNRAGPLPAKTAEDGEAIVPGVIYTARPDFHLLVKEGCIRVSHGPRENRTRPAIDPLFRSAAAAYGSRVVGVILTGLLDDGAAGLLAVKRCNGVAIVQDPDDAAYPGMPDSALRSVNVDYILPLAEIGPTLARLAQQPAKEAVPIPPDMLLEVKIGEQGKSRIGEEAELGTLAPFTCPECSGALWQLENDPLHRYRCHTGHALTARSLLAEQKESLERSLWAAMRAMEDRARLLVSIARDERERGREKAAADYEAQAAETKTHAARIRTLLMNSY